MDLTELLLFAKEAGGSDLHISAGAPPMLRCSGQTRKLALPGADSPLAIDADDARRLVYDVLNDRQKKRLETEKELDFALTVGSRARFRGNIFFQQRGVSAVFRVIPTEILGFDDLDIPESIRAFARLEKGLVLVTGPTGSGKSTTLAAVIDAINRERRGHILTIEDPIEFVHVSRRCMVNQREVGPHTLGFARALRSALREDPDVILVGEMRDLETISLAITAAETGHLVFGTLHTQSAAKTVDRVINVFPSNEQEQIRATLADALAGIVAQILLPKEGGGRVAAFEILVATQAARAQIREGKTHQLLSTIQTGQRHGMRTLEQSLMKLLMEQKLSRHTVERYLTALGLAHEKDARPRREKAEILSRRELSPEPPKEEPPGGGGRFRYRYI